MIAESTDLGITQLTDADVNWQVQLGPDISGALEGVINSTEGSFLVSPQSALDLVFAEISTNAGANWYPMPNNVWVNAAGNNDIQYRINPQNTRLKFLIALD